jgi:hypothetical protein
MRTIVHLDADAFFASVEQAADTRLRGKPFAVGGESRGIIASASYEARKFGIYTPMPTARARKLCPKLIVFPGDYERYGFIFDKPFALGIRESEKQLLAFFLERVGNLFQKDQAEADVLVFRSVHVPAHFVGSRPQLGFKVEVRAV